jgi:phosphoesterase RecJ-like protein
MQELISALHSAHRIIAIAHIRPDGDAAGSVIGFAQALKQLGKEVVPVLKDGVPTAFQYLEGTSEVVQTFPENADLCVVLDAPDSARTGYSDLVRAYGQAGKLALIDHHMKGDLIKRAQYVLYDSEASSTAELVAQLVQALELKLTPGLSTALLTGMYTDTGGFQYGNTTNTTLDIAAELMRRGARLNKVVQNVARQRTVAGLKLLGIALSRLTLTPDKRGAVTVLSLDDMTHCNATPEDAGGLVSALNVLPEVAYCLLLTEIEPGIVRGTLRTADNHSFDVAKYASLFGGGGHPKAAGFAVNGHLTATPTGWKIEPALLG